MRRPRFLSFLAVWLSVAATAGTVVVPWLLFGNADTYTVDGVPVTREEFQALLRPLLPFFAILIVSAGASAWALWTEKRVGRPFVLATLLVVLAGGALLAPDASIAARAAVATVSSLVVGLPLLWYLYFKPSVVAYYESLRAAGPGGVSRTL